MGIAGFASGIVVMFAMRAYTERIEARQEQAGKAMPTGLLLTLALTIEYLFVGLSLAAALGPGTRRRTLVVLPTALALLTVVEAAGGIIVLGGVSAAVLAGVLAFGAVAFMYLVTRRGTRTRRDGLGIGDVLRRVPAVHGLDRNPRQSIVNGQAMPGCP